MNAKTRRQRQLDIHETELHQNLVDWLRKIGQPVYPALRFVKHTPNEALGSGSDTRPVRQSDGSFRNVPISVLRGAQMGVKPGVWDFEFLCPNDQPLSIAPAFLPLKNIVSGCYLGLAFEMKAEGGTLSDDQKIWGEHYARNGWFTAVFAGDWTPAARFLIGWVGGDPRRIEGL